MQTQCRIGPPSTTLKHETVWSSTLTPADVWQTATLKPSDIWQTATLRPAAVWQTATLKYETVWPTLTRAPVWPTLTRAPVWPTPPLKPDDGVSMNTITNTIAITNTITNNNNNNNNTLNNNHTNNVVPANTTSKKQQLRELIRVRFQRTHTPHIQRTQHTLYTPHTQQVVQKASPSLQPDHLHYRRASQRRLRHSRFGRV
jgi:hypothetical protein